MWCSALAEIWTWKTVKKKRKSTKAQNCEICQVEQQLATCNGHHFNTKTVLCTQTAAHSSLFSSGWGGGIVRRWAVQFTALPWQSKHGAGRVNKLNQWLSRLYLQGAVWEWRRNAAVSPSVADAALLFLLWHFGAACRNGTDENKESNYFTCDKTESGGTGVESNCRGSN